MSSNIKNCKNLVTHGTEPKGVSLTYSETPSVPSIPSKINRENKFWSARIDAPYIKLSIEYLDLKQIPYFFAQEFATREHYQGIIFATTSQKEKFSKSIKTKNKNDKGFSICRNIESLRRYCCKGTGIGEPPTKVFDTLNIDINKENAEYYASQNKGIVNLYQWKGPTNTPTKRKRTVFSSLLDHCDENYDPYIINGPNKKRRKTITTTDASKLVSLYYSHDNRLAGTGVRKKAFEEIILRYGDQKYITNFSRKLIYDFENSIEI